jgi:ABC-2 type transport system permease protein
VPIFDQGYQHWSGTLSGHTWRGLAIARHGIRVGRKNRFVRMLILLACLPALVLAVALCGWGLLERGSDLIAPLKPFLSSIIDPQMLDAPKTFRVQFWTICYDYFLLTELRVSLVLVLLVGPSLISQDLRFNALPLYFSRPLRRYDYFLGKLGVIVGFISMVTIVPSLIAYALGLLFSLDLTIIRDTYGLLFSCVAYGLVIAVSSGVLMLALSTLSRNSRYVGLFWLGIWILSSTVSNILQVVDQEQRRREAFTTAANSSPQPPNPGPRRGRMGGMPGLPPGMATFATQQLEASKANWRPLVSYTENLSRVGRELLGTNAAWTRLSELQPPGMREIFLLRNRGQDFPWYWSAAMLGGLFVFSAGILSFRIKSLDRLK